MVEYKTYQPKITGMQEFTSYINYCAQQYQGKVRCPNCPYGRCIHDNPADTNTDCYSCLNKIHRIYNHTLTYQCERIIYNYVLKHGHRYASEMDKIMSFFVAHPVNSISLNIYSIGCGPTTELFGVLNQLKPYHVVHFKGFDISEIWQPLTAYARGLFPADDVQFVIGDYFAYVLDTNEHVDVLIMNYMLSDLARYKSVAERSAFIDNIVRLCESRRVSYIVINDVYLTYGTGTGYVLMEELSRKLFANKNINEGIFRGHFATPNRFQSVYGRKCPDNLSFPITELGVQPFNPFSTCGSLFMIVKIQ